MLSGLRPRSTTSPPPLLNWIQLWLRLSTTPPYSPAKPPNPYQPPQPSTPLASWQAYFHLVQKQVVDLVPKYIQLLLVEEPKALITKAIGGLTDVQVADLMAPAPMNTQ